MEGDSSVQKVKPACSNDGRWEGMNNLDEESWVMQEAGSIDEVKHVGRSGEWLWVMMMVWSEWHKVKSVCGDREEAE